MTTTTLPSLPEPTLDERHDRIIARLTRRLAEQARQRRLPPALAPHDFLVQVLRPDFVTDDLGTALTGSSCG